MRSATVMAAAMALAGAARADATDAVRAHIEQRFGPRAGEALASAKFGELKEQYDRAMTVVSIAQAFADCRDAEGLKQIAEEIGAAALDALAPGVSRVVGWIGWVKTGMQLFKTWVFDPAIEHMNVESYIKARAALDPPDSFAASIRAYGQMRLAALARFRAEYGEMVFVAGQKDVLLPRWEDRLNQFANAWFEAQYQKRVLEETRRKLAAERDRQLSLIAALDDAVARSLGRAPDATSSEPKPPGSPSPADRPEAWPGRWSGEVKVTMATDGGAPTVVTQPMTLDVSLNGSTVRVTAVGGKPETRELIL